MIFESDSDNYTVLHILYYTIYYTGTIYKISSDKTKHYTMYIYYKFMDKINIIAQQLRNNNNIIIKI